MIGSSISLFLHAIVALPVVACESTSCRGRFFDCVRRSGLRTGCATTGESAGSAQPGSDQDDRPAAGERDQRPVGSGRVV